MTRVAVVGGGFLGMALARGLHAAGRQATLFEAAPGFGGLANAWRLGDVTWDRFYHVICLSDLRTQALLRELRLDGDLVWGTTRTGFYTDGRLVSMSNNWEFLRFPPLGLWDKALLARTIVAASRETDWRRLEAIPAVDWLRGLSGRRTTEKIWIPLLRSKLGEDYPQASAAFLWATIQRMYAARRSGLKKEMFGYVRGGYGRIVDALVADLGARGVELRPGTAVRAVARQGNGFDVSWPGGAERFDEAVVAAPPPAALALCPDLAGDARDRLAGVRMQGIVCPSLLLEKPLGGFYVTNITEPMPFTAVIETSALVERAAFGGRTLAYLPKYVAPDDPLFAESDDAIRARFLPALARMHPHLDLAKDVAAFQVARAKHVFAFPALRYSERVPAFATNVPGLWTASGAQIVNGTLNVNETLLLADRALAAALGGEAPR